TIFLSPHLPHPPPPPFPYTTLFRSDVDVERLLLDGGLDDDVPQPGDHPPGLVAAQRRDPSLPGALRTEAAQGLEPGRVGDPHRRSEEHTSELQSLTNLVCRLLLEKK